MTNAKNDFFFIKKKICEDLNSLRDITIFAFVMINVLFVLIVFLLQLKKDYIHVQWPFNVKNIIKYERSIHEITIHREHLKLEPIGLVFVVFFGLILGVQFISMLIHRFGTISQILATTSLNWYCGSSQNEASPQAELKGAAIDIARRLQKPQEQWDEAAMGDIERRGTIHKILYQHRNKTDFSNLETNFRRAYFKDGDLNLGRFTVSRKTLTLLDTRRKSMVEQRKLRKSQLVNHSQNGNVDNNYQTAQWLRDTQHRNNIDESLSAAHSLQPESFSASYFNEGFEPDNGNDNEFEMMGKANRKQSHVTFAQEFKRN